MNATAFHIAKRYLLSKKGSQAVSFITGLAALAMMVAVAAMFIIISVFSGLEEMNQSLIENLHADLTLSSKKGKTLPNIQKITQTLAQQKEISHFSKTIEEKAYLDYNNVGEIAYLRGVDSAYTMVNPIHNSVFFGQYPSFEFKNEVVLENGLDNRLSIPVGSTQDYAQLFMPKAGKGIISKESDIFNKKEVYITGVFNGKDQLNNYIIAPIELAQELLDLPKHSAYQIVIKLVPNANPDDVKNELEQKLGGAIKITTKEEENAAFWKMINTEKLMIYLIFALVIFITTFNLAGAIIILQLDKKEQSKTLISLGLTVANIRKIYFYTGLLIVLFGVLFGLIIGSLICFIQMQTGIFKASEVLPFPVKIELKNYLIVALTALIFGGGISYFFSKTKKEYFSNF
ncbi:ABC transporter permease [Riemerella columbina]|uniref:ABC transporter permease n=1 Tax=Riemerella columbina TaxID=103810 RepID=UPI00266F6EC3|nr:ABC transporter permease [Riemerella columbina]WKS95878.1 ABC transporter permease [Riemerella columbina]